MRRRAAGPLAWAAGTLAWVVGTVAVAPLLGRAPVAVVAQAIIEASPGAVATLAIETLGERAQPALMVGVGAATVALGAAVGAVGNRTGTFSGRGSGERARRALGAGVFAATAWLCFLAAGGATLGWIAASVLAVLPPTAVYWVRTTRRPGVARRRALGQVGAAAGAVLGAGVLSRALGPSGEPGDDGPQPGESLAAVAEKARGTTTPTGPEGRVTQSPTATPSADGEGVQTRRTQGEVVISVAESDADFGFDFEGMPERVGSAAAHYVVDKNVDDPRVDADTWTLTVDGEVSIRRGYDFADLVGHEAARDVAVTTACISNTVGGDLIGTAEWRVVPLRALLSEAQVLDGATEVVTIATDGYSEAIPWAEVRDRPDIAVAVGMEGRTLPQEHGFPARLLIPGRYGMKSTKWVERIELRESDHEGYWQQRGWVEEAVVNTLSYVRAVQRRGDRVAVGGVAYAGRRGVDRVEASVDGGETWTDATLEDPASPHTWRRWRLVLDDAGGGPLDIVVRATDGEGDRQTAEESGPHPGGSTGWHSIGVSV